MVETFSVNVEKACPVCAEDCDDLDIDIDDYASNSIKAKIEAFLRLR